MCWYLHASPGKINKNLMTVIACGAYMGCKEDAERNSDKQSLSFKVFKQRVDTNGEEGS